MMASLRRDRKLLVASVAGCFALNFQSIAAPSNVEWFSLDAHHYRVDTSVGLDGDAPLTSDGVEAIALAPPKEFGAQGSRWSPEALLTAAAADCLILNFRDIGGFSRSLRRRRLAPSDHE
jgi:organic hydroperoxide reductase OsmC/OhrA